MRRTGRAKSPSELHHFSANFVEVSLVVRYFGRRELLRRRRGFGADGNCARGGVEVGEVDAQSGPAGAKAHALGPFDNDDGGIIEEVFDTESFEVVKIGDAVEIDVKNANVIFESVDESESGAGDFVFASCAEAGDEAFGKSCFASAEFAGEKDKSGRF